MQSKLNNKFQSQKGFALLLTIVVVSITLAVGLSLLNITLKQFTLSVTTYDSERSFHAANAALECAREARDEIDVDSPPSNISFDCFENSYSITISDQSSGADETYFGSRSISWTNNGEDYCSEFSLYVQDARDGSFTYSFNDEGIADRNCPNGVICTTLFGRGYNRSCNDLDSIRTVQRELTERY